MAKVISQPKKKEAAPKSPSLSAEETREVERLAYQFFIGRGNQHGHDVEDWAKAEAIVRKRRLS